MIKDRNALLIDQKAVMESKEIMVKDLGAQVRLSFAQILKIGLTRL